MYVYIYISKYIWPTTIKRLKDMFANISMKIKNADIKFVIL